MIVAVDGSDDSAVALIAGRTAAAVLHAELAIATVQSGGTADDAPLDEAATGALEALQRDFLERAFGAGGVPHHDPLLLTGEPAHALLHAAADADLLVIGGRGRGGFPGLPLGSVALLCVLYAPCPVLLVRADQTVPAFDSTDTPGARTVVVGAAGSAPRSSATVRDAMRVAQLLDAGLLVVSAWHPLEPQAPAAEPSPRAESIAQEQQQQMLHSLFGPDVPRRVRTALREGSPAGVLVAESAEADLLVVGSDERDTMTGKLSAVVALTAAAHAVCPVLVMHPVRRAALQR